MSQLRSDIAKTLQAAKDCLTAYAPGEPGLAKAVRQWIDSSARFLEPDADIAEAYRHFDESVETLVRIGSSGNSIDHQSVKTARSHALFALDALRTKIFELGRASKAADRVGIGEYGKPI